MTLTRDSLVLWGLFVLTLAGYLKLQPPLGAWTYYDWLDLVLFVGAWVVGKLQHSPLPSRAAVDARDRVRRLFEDDEP